METTAIYEKHLKTVYDVLRNKKNEMFYASGHPSLYVMDKYNLCNIFSNDENTFSYLVNLSAQLLNRALFYIVCDLMSLYGYSFLSNRDNSKRSDMFFVLNQNDMTLFLFKQFGINNDVPPQILSSLKAKLGAAHHKYISCVEDLAYTEDLGFNDADPSDPSRGTNKYSYRFFFESMFSPEEYGVFKESYDAFISQIKKNLGIKIVYSLNEDVSYQFKTTLINSFNSFNYNSPIKVNDRCYSISEDQIHYIKDQFIDQQTCYLLIGNSDFSRSFMTAEWLFTSLNMVSLHSFSSVDLTAIELGYFKAIEQALLAFITLLSNDKTAGLRNIHVLGMNEDPRVNSGGYLDLTSENLQDQKIKEKITLGSLLSFIRYKGNSDLLRPKIDEQTKDYIDNLTKKINGLRNGYLHKDNLYSWDDVIEVRKDAYMLFFLLFGAYKLSSADAESLGVVLPKKTSYYKCCEDIYNRIISQQDNTELLMLYLEFQDGHTSYCIPIQDNDISFDENCNPIFSGIHVNLWNETLQLFDKNQSMIFTENNMPLKIYTATMQLPKKIEEYILRRHSFSELFSEPEELIYIHE